MLRHACSSLRRHWRGSATLGAGHRESSVDIDQTEALARLAYPGSRFVLFRPPMFSHSQLVGSLRSLFGDASLRSELEGTWIATNRPQVLRQPAHPVLVIDMALVTERAAEALAHDPAAGWSALLEQATVQHLGELAEPFGVPPTATGSLSSGADAAAELGRVVQDVSRACDRRVVLLVDSFDAPILRAPPHARRACLDATTALVRATNELFRPQGEGSRPCLHYVFLGGCLRWGDPELVQAVEQFRDISLDFNHNDICGLTHEVLNSTLGDAALGEQLMSRVGSYWFGGVDAEGEAELVCPTTALPQGAHCEQSSQAALRTLLNEANFGNMGVAGLKAVCDALSSFVSLDRYTHATVEPGSCDWPALFLQSGLLTLADRTMEFDEFHAYADVKLGVPNHHAQQVLLAVVFDHLRPSCDPPLLADLRALREAMLAQQADARAESDIADKNANAAAFTVEQALQAARLEEYLALFERERLVVDDLPELTLDDMKEMGIPMGHRKQLHRTFAELFASCERQPSIKDSQKDAALSLLNKLTDQWIGAQSFDSKDDYVGEQLLRLCLLCMDAASTPERAVVEHVDRNNVVMRLTLASVSFELVSGGAAHGSSKRMWTRVA